ncbi:adenylyl-sulfate kinase [Agarivorans albus]|uniref:Adenylyl-sulfate kinase n=1 Tax=Agarivorans albus MKT 106 TaxID=1331007 RepID=R9PN55_AGAAL|nr:adenylyl-sulfate kinase [Agarivorans albus]GAD02774.1 adenylylsulfate kinase [Agarivorans albus MKT 106]
MDKKSENVVWHNHSVNRELRIMKKGHKPCVLWFTGLSGSGKSTIANAVDYLLYQRGVHTYVLDGDNVRHGLNGDLGFSDTDRVENIRRIGEVAKLFVDAGLVVSTAFISPFKADRSLVRNQLDDGEFFEVFIDTPLEVCEQRDPKGLYKKARSGEIKNFTGISSAYEAPEEADVHVETDGKSVEQCAEFVVNALIDAGIVKA